MEIFALLICLAVLFFGEMALYRRRGARGLTYRCYFLETEVTEGEPITLIEIVENHKRLPMPYVKTELTLDDAFAFTKEDVPYAENTRFLTGFFSLRSRVRVKRVHTATCTRFGAYRIENGTIRYRDVFGAVKDSFPAVDLGKELLVLPRMDMPIDLLSTHTPAGGTETVRRGMWQDPSLFRSLREYVYGDSPRLIHWRASAHRGKYLVREGAYMGQKRVTVVLCLETQSSEFGAVQDAQKAAQTVRVCATVLRHLCQNDAQVRLVVGERNVHGFLHTLPCFSGETGLRRAREMLARLSKKDVLPQKTLWREVMQKTEGDPILFVAPYQDETLKNISGKRGVIWVVG